MKIRDIEIVKIEYTFTHYQTYPTKRIKRALRVNRRSAVCDSRYKSKNICRSRVRELHDAGKKITEIRARSLFGDVKCSNRNRSCNHTKRITRIT